MAVVLRGGFWRARYGVELARPLAADLAADGWAAVAVEYRPVGAGGGWPQTLQDVAAAVDLLSDLPGAQRLDPTDVTVVGHSAGGHLAAWLAGRGRLRRVRRGRAPGAGAVAAFLGGAPDVVPDRYATADPVRLLPTGAAVLCVHGTGDDTVPLEQSRPPCGRVGLTAGVLVRSDCRSSVVGTVHLMSRANDLTDMQ